MANSVGTTQQTTETFHQLQSLTSPQTPLPLPSPPLPLSTPSLQLLPTERNNKFTKSNFCFCVRWRKKAMKKTIDIENDDIINEESFAIDFRVLQIATNDFSNDNKLGEDALGPVYKGVLEGNQEIAVRRFHREELKHEVSLIGKFQHRNLVRLIGYSTVEDEMLLVYEYMRNKSLTSFLYDNKRSKILDWGIRFKIIEGIIKGLLYLHEDSQVNIIHRNLKPGSIFLDAKMNPKISDLGISRLFDVEHNQGGFTGTIDGTLAYMAPEYVTHGYISTKMDVYSLGIIILEILTGKNADGSSNLTDKALTDLIYFVRNHWKDGMITQMLDKNLVQSYSIEKEEEISRTINIALLCVQDEPELRPKISDILLMLRGHFTPLPDPLNERRKKGEHKNITDLEDLAMEFVDLERATNNFSNENKLGEGGSGPVYKGMAIKDKQEIAVKRLVRNSKNGLQLLRNEVLLLARLQHKYLVRILGYCIKDVDMLLVYEYMPNRSLDKILFDPVHCKNLCWGIRLKIIQGIAEGLEFLHENSPQKIIIHRDLKPANILLDADMNPKISDFGISKFYHEDMTHLSTLHIYGTRGYMAPEYLSHGQISTKSDIYSFGVMILEILTGICNQSVENLPRYVLEHWKNTSIADVLDKNVGETPTKEQEEKLSRIIDIALLCVDHDTKVRPNISRVLQVLTNHPTTLPATSSFKGKGILQI